MTKCNVSSSDLALARSLSRLLVGQTVVPGEPDGGAPEASYMRFRAGGGPGPVPAEVAAPVGEWVPLDMDTWETLLAWSLEMCQARSAFVVDSEGFVIGSRGNVPEDAFEGTGAELCYAMEMLDRVDPEAGPLRAVDLHFAGRNLVALCAEEESCGRFVIGFVGSQPLSSQVRDAIVTQLAHSLPDLR